MHIGRQNPMRPFFRSSEISMFFIVLRSSIQAGDPVTASILAPFYFGADAATRSPGRRSYSFLLLFSAQFANALLRVCRHSFVLVQMPVTTVELVLFFCYLILDSLSL